MTDAEPAAPTSAPTDPDTRRRLAGLVAVGLTALLLGGAAFVAAGSALAEDATSSPSASVGSTDQDGKTLRKRLRERFLDLRGTHGPGLAGSIGMGGGIHGEFVTPDGSGGYRTTLTQQGEVTSVSRDSITVKSEDNYTQTYVVTDSTIVNASRDGIDDVAVGHDVHILAVRNDGNDTAVHIGDLTTLRESADQWDLHPGGQAPALEQPGATTT